MVAALSHTYVLTALCSIDHTPMFRHTYCIVLFLTLQDSGIIAKNLERLRRIICDLNTQSEKPYCRNRKGH